MSFATKRYVDFCMSSLVVLSHLGLLCCASGRLQRHAMPTVNGTTTRWLRSRMPFIPTALSSVPFVMKLAHARFMRSCVTTGTGKSTFPSLHFFPLLIAKPQNAARNSRKRTVGSVCLAPRKHHLHLHTQYTPQTTRTRKVQSCARRAKRT